MPRIDEASRRRDGFRGEVPVRLADGQEWHLPRPRVSIVPVFEAGDVAYERRLNQGRDYDALLDRYFTAPDEAGIISSLVLMARHLLLQNYDLEDEEVGDLMRSTEGGEDQVDWAAIQSVVTGHAPKA